MQLFSVILGLSLARIGAAVEDVNILEALESRKAPITCPQNLLVIGIGGAGHEDPPYGGLTTLISNITAEIPGTANISVPYNKVHKMEPKHFKIGSMNLDTLVMNFTAACPDTKYAIVGYSSGAIITMNSLCGYNAEGQKVDGLKREYAKNCIAVTGYGDESRKANEPYDYGTCTRNGPAPRPYRKCGAFRPVIRQICDAEDPYCCAGGTIRARHFEYPARYDLKLAAYVKSQYLASMGT